MSEALFDGRVGNRGLTSVLQYALVLFLVSLLVSGLVFGFSEVVLDQREQTVRSNLEVAGHRIAEGFATVDRLAANDTAAAVTIDLSTEVVGTQYDIAVENQGNDSTVVLESRNPDVIIRVGFVTETAVEETTVGGGPITVRYDRADDELEVVSSDG